jgi:predicted nucleotidyltransferase
MVLPEHYPLMAKKQKGSHFSIFGSVTRQHEMVHEHGE